MDKRVFSQAINMKSNYEHSYIIMVGTYEDVRANRYQNMPINRFIGALTDLLMLYKVPVLQCENNEQFWRYCQSIFKKENGSAPKKIRKVNKYKGNGELAILCSIPGLGEKRANAIIKQFPSIHDICHAETEDLMSVRGIGKKHATNIKKALNTKGCK